MTVRLVDWADEEGARFGRSLLGSSAVAGTLDPDDVRDLRDAEGTRLQDALADCDVDLDGAGAASARLDGALAYLELHIEQGPVLLDSGPARVGGQRHVRRRALPDHVHGPGRARGLDADAPAPRLARRGGDRGAGDPRGRHPPRRRLHGRRDEGRAGRDHRDRGLDRDDARPPPPRRRHARDDARREPRGVPARGGEVRLRGLAPARVRRDADAVPPAAGGARARGGRRRRRRRRASRSRPARCTTRPRSAASSRP